MKKSIVVLLSVFALLSGVDRCFGQVSATRGGGLHLGRDRRPDGYSKDSWTVYYRERKVEGASAGSFANLGGGYGKDAWTVFFQGRKISGASSSSFENIGKGYGKDAWNVYYRGEKVRGASPGSFEVPSERW
ncbi:MAG: DKNYY domain-containing protein [Alistipes sp.]|uniref:DKNYY domain-containing protein n=1 Tax=Alistipes sp. TaxID=1872444 RepID=UPI0025BC04C5|nr:DKNYY domain-containing protein [Alistipes sp.]MCD8275663.1 DKNYY domain-containing protein [Alistipes sp.]